MISRLENEVWPHTSELWLSCAGEPLINDNLALVLSNAAKAGIPKIGLITNAYALDEQRARILITCGLTDICVSIDGATKKVYEEIRHLSNFERVIDNVRRLQQIKKTLGSRTPHLEITAIIMLENLAELASIVDLAADLEADHVHFQGQIYYEEFKEKRRICDFQDEVNTALENAQSVANDRGIKIMIPGNFHRKDSIAAHTSSAQSKSDEKNERTHVIIPGTRLLCILMVKYYLVLLYLEKVPSEISKRKHLQIYSGDGDSAPCAMEPVGEISILYAVDAQQPSCAT